MRSASRISLTIAAIGLLGGCQAPGPAVEPEAYSLLGEPLYAPELPEDVLLERSAKLAEAYRIYQIDPTNENSIIWFGRRLAYLGRYHEALGVYTDGLALHPDSARLLRHRGHRYITLRQFDEAIADLSRAADLVRGEPDATEPDGMPNARGIPRSTTQTNIYYHLGLAYYLEGDWEKSRLAYATCLAKSPNDDMTVAAAYWLVLDLHRLGLPQVADALLEDISPGMEIMENHAYHRLLLYFKGARSLEQTMAGEADALQNTTLAYGLAAWKLVNKRRDEAAADFRLIVATTDQWAAFGYIAAEAELARAGR